MKLTRRFKVVLYVSLATLYLAGLGNWILHNWFKIDRGLGLEPSWQEIALLRLHGVVGLWFLMVFGYLFHSHVLRAIRGARKLKTGYSLLVLCIVLVATVPCLYYINAEGPRATVAWIHTYLGLLAALPFFAHLLTKSRVRVQHGPTRGAR